VSYTIRAYRPDDRPRVAELMRRLWSPRRSRNEAYLAWRYEQNPYLEPVIAVCEHDGEIAGVRGAYGMRWRIGDAPVDMPCVGDTVVASAHEGRSLVQRMTRWLFSELAHRGIEWVTNQSPGPVVQKISMRAGWRRVGDWTVARSVRRVAGAARAFEHFDAHRGACAQVGGFRVKAGMPDAAALDGLARRIRTDHAGHIRDGRYFQWRVGNPMTDYRWLCAYRDELEGCLLLGRGVLDKHRVRVLDLSGPDSQIKAMLLQEALDRGRFQEVRLWWNRFPRQVVEVLRERDFRAAPPERRRATHLLARTARGEGGFTVNGVDLLNPSNWDPRMIHSDAT